MGSSVCAEGILGLIGIITILTCTVAPTAAQAGCEYQPECKSCVSLNTGGSVCGWCNATQVCGPVLPSDDGAGVVHSNCSGSFFIFRTDCDSASPLDGAHEKPIGAWLDDYWALPWWVHLLYSFGALAVCACIAVVIWLVRDDRKFKQKSQADEREANERAKEAIRNMLKEKDELQIDSPSDPAAAATTNTTAAAATTTTAAGGGGGGGTATAAAPIPSKHSRRIEGGVFGDEPKKQSVRDSIAIVPGAGAINLESYQAMMLIPDMRAEAEAKLAAEKAQAAADATSGYSYSSEIDAALIELEEMKLNTTASTAAIATATATATGADADRASDSASVPGLSREKSSILVRDMLNDSGSFHSYDDMMGKESKAAGSAKPPLGSSNLRSTDYALHDDGDVDTDPDLNLLLGLDVDTPQRYSTHKVNLGSSTTGSGEASNSSLGSSSASSTGVGSSAYSSSSSSSLV